MRAELVIRLDAEPRTPAEHERHGTEMWGMYPVPRSADAIAEMRKWASEKYLKTCWMDRLPGVRCENPVDRDPQGTGLCPGHLEEMKDC